ncbi:retinoid-inducible serine carboxypeptidase [Monodelphis domestica]|uniref:retinoid-inducible serine carboxypeptidase n=1 Tax=Monodelphis domestica TaxID=13616 RepID=UPI0004436579|nr:retinoid-inducible serine carboxypeptidase [Monodelphis domestica]XP_056672522.1 retinoid-inducible serine carboxypeptidase [Monodelphis domestica]XP_056672523.1 retinoid-inducible serine carboxypeptidase [Monodelphis domestica]XP_056672524.1 retinoid-inducible serine carboxypeptidase [Monodelphis domestica]XP_056672526.1 retinoid-inducible serine carboxypeptidase [Monodelphis domestica]
MELVPWHLPALPLLLLLLLNLSPGLALVQQVEEGKEAWDYVTVRTNASMFWWLYYAKSPCKNFTELPLIMWLQGGPGGSSTGFGNFDEIGPLDEELKPRKTTWLQSASLLFVDNPVGTGFSFVNQSDAYARDLDMVASDMMVLLKSFFNSRPEFETVPFYIFSESYGGKMAAGISRELYKAIQNGSIKCKFSGVALGDSWISPIDSVLSWGPYLYSMSLLDDKSLSEVSKVAEKIINAMNMGLYDWATELWGKAEMLVEQDTDGVNFYNILNKSPPESTMKSSLEFTQRHLSELYHRHVRKLHQDKLSSLMNGPIRKKLKIIPDFVTWGDQSHLVFMNMQKDFMKPVINIVDDMLTAGINVTIYNGQLDLIVDTIGQEAWLRKLKWPELARFNEEKRKPLYVNPGSYETAAFYKSYKNLAFYWILKAGHMVPSDQGEMALKMMRMVTGQEES